MPETPPDRRRRLAVIAAVCVLAVVAVVFFVVRGHHDKDAQAKADLAAHPAFGPTGTPVATPTATPTALAPPSQVPFTQAPPTQAVQPVTLPTVSTAKPSPPGALKVSARTIALGTKGTKGSITVANTGGQPISVTLNPAAGWLSVRPASALIPAGAKIVAAVTADRSKAAEGDLTAVVAITSDVGTASVPVTMRVEHPPVVGKPSAGAPAGCAVPISVTVTDESGVASARLTWSGAGGSGSTDMVQKNGVWTASVTPNASGGPITFRVTATDTRGNTATGKPLQKSFAACSPPSP